MSCEACDMIEKGVLPSKGQASLCSDCESNGVLKRELVRK